MKWLKKLVSCLEKKLSAKSMIIMKPKRACRCYSTENWNSVCLVPRTKKKISARVTGVEKKRSYLSKCQDSSFERMVVRLRKVLIAEVMKFKNTTYMETRQSVGAYSKARQTSLKNLDNLVATLLVLPSLPALAISDNHQITEHEAVEEESGDYARSFFEYQFDVDGKASPH